MSHTCPAFAPANGSSRQVIRPPEPSARSETGFPLECTNVEDGKRIINEGHDDVVAADDLSEVTVKAAMAVKG